MIKFIVTLLILLTLIIILKKRDFFFDKSIQNIDGDLDRFERKYPIECKLFNEIIDRKNKDLERQCYYKCEENDIVRVDTSIEYICQPFIIEER